MQNNIFFNKGKEYFQKEQWHHARTNFLISLNEEKSNQSIFPYLAFSSLKTKDFEDVDLFLSYPFNNLLITDINGYDMIVCRQSNLNFSIESVLSLI